MAEKEAPASAQADRLEDLARRVGRLSVSRRDPEAFFAERSEIEHALRNEAWKRRSDARRGVSLDSGNR